MAEIDASWRGDKVSYWPPKLKLLPRRDIGDWAATLPPFWIAAVLKSKWKTQRKYAEFYIYHEFCALFSSGWLHEDDFLPLFDVRGSRTCYCTKHCWSTSRGPIAYISTGKQFQFWRLVRNLVSSPRRIYFCHKIGMIFRLLLHL